MRRCVRVAVLLAGAAGMAAGGGVPGSMQRAFDVTADFGCSFTGNPASLARLDQPRLTVAYFPLYADGDYYNYFSAAYPLLEKMTLGVARVEAGMDDIAGVDALNRAMGEYFTDRQTLYLVSAAQAVDERLSVGVNVKFAGQECFGDRGLGWGIDAGVRFRPLPELELGAGIHNFILRPHLSLGRDEITWPAYAWAEAAYRATGYLHLTAELGLEDLFAPAEEYADAPPLSLRWRGGAAYRVMENGSALLTAGPDEAQAGFTYSHQVFRLSYLFAYHYALGFTYRTTLDLTYGRSRGEVEARAAATGKKRETRQDRKRAQRLLDKGEYWRAAREFGELHAAASDSQRAGLDAGLALSLQGLGLHYAAEKAAAGAGEAQLERADLNALLYSRFKQAVRVRETARAEALFVRLESSAGGTEEFDRALYDMAVLCRGTGEYGRIPGLLEKVRPGSGCYMYAQYWLGQLASARGDADGALACFDRVIGSRPPDDAQKLFRYKAQQKAGHVLFGLGRFDDAYDRYARALGGDYRRDETLIGIAWTFFRQNEFQRSLGAAEQLLEEYAESPYAAEAELLSGYCFMVLDYYEEASDRFNRALESAVVSGVDTVEAASAAAGNLEKVRELHRDVRQAEEQLLAYLTDPALIALDDARERLRTKIDVLKQKVAGLERSMSAYRRSAARDRVALAVRREAEFGLAITDGLLKEEKMKMMKDAYERKMQELEQMMDEAR